MAIGTTAAAIGGSLASSAASAGVSKLLGGKPSSDVNFGSTDIKTPFLNFSTEGAKVFATPTNRGADLLSRLQGQGERSQSRLSPLFDRVRIGQSEVRNARLGAIDRTFNTARSRAIGDLRGNLSRRGVLGSSFADSAFGAIEGELADQEARARADAISSSLLEEIDATTRLISQEFNIASSVLQEQLNQGRFETTTAVNLLNGTQQAMAQNAALQQELALQNAQGAGAFFEPAISGLSESVSKELSDIFGIGKAA